MGEQVAEFNYRPGACAREYLVVVLRKQLIVEQHGQRVGEETRYFFYITNEWTWERPAVVYFANDRGNQEMVNSPPPAYRLLVWHDPPCGMPYCG